MKKIIPIIAIFLFLVVPVSVFSQNVKIRWSDPRNRGGDISCESFLDEDNYGIYLSSSTDVFFSQFRRIVVLDEKLNPVNELQIGRELKELGYKPGLEVKLGNKLFSIQREDNSSMENLYIQEINRDDLKLVSNRKKIYEFSTKKKEIDLKYKISYSMDEKKFALMVIENKSTLVKTNLKVDIIIIDENMNKLWDKYFEIEERNYPTEIDDMIITNRGDMAISIRKFSRYKNHPPRVDTYVIAQNGKKDEIYAVDIQGKHVYRSGLCNNQPENISNIIFYLDQKGDGLEGFIHFGIDLTGSATSTTFHKLPLKFYTQYLPDSEVEEVKELYKKGRSNKSDITNMKAVSRNDGSMVVFAEKEKRDPKTEIVHNKINEEVVIIDIDKNGGINWIENVPKYQNPFEPSINYASYAYAVTQSHTYILFNDVLENLNNYKSGNLKKFNRGDIRSAILTMATIDSEGNQTRKALDNSAALGATLVPRSTKKMNEKQLMIYAANNSDEHRLGIITIDD